MDLMPSPEQEEIASTVARLLAERVPVVGLGREVGGDIDDALWRECSALGWLSLGLPEHAGGVGFGPAEEVTLFRELGRGLAPGPFLPGTIGAHLAAAAGDIGLARAIASGTTRVALGTPQGPVAVGEQVDAVLSVVHAPAAELVLLCTPEGSVLVRADDVPVREIDGIDTTVPVAMGRAAGARSVAHVAGDAMYTRAMLLVAALATGVADGAMRTAVAYASQRHQFGKPIGAFQAVKHSCADMAVRVELAEAQTYFGSVALTEGLATAAQEARVAKYVACDAAQRNADAAVQVHGAIGFTAEATPYRYVLRANVLAQQLSGRASLLDAILGREAPATP